MNYRIPTPNTVKYEPKVYHCRRAEETLVPDGDLDKKFWEKAPWTEDFVDIEGDVRPVPRFRTRAKMLWDEENFYFGAELIGSEIWSYVTERDDVIFRDNDFEIFIDPDSDTQEYCEFEMNAANVVWDLLLTKAYRDGGRPMNGFDLKGLTTAVKIHGKLNDPTAENTRWTCEVVIPFKTLAECNGSVRPSLGDFWRVNFSRVQWTVDVVDGKYVKRKDPATGNFLPEDNWVWSPTGIINMHYPELWGYVFFVEDQEKCSIPENEYRKWELRRMYYAQHKCFDETGSFDPKLKPFCDDLEVKVQVTDNGFEMSCPAADGEKRIVIFADGKTAII